MEFNSFSIDMENLHVLGAQFGNVHVKGFYYEHDEIHECILVINQKMFFRMLS